MSKNIYSQLLRRETNLSYGNNPLKTRTREVQTDPEPAPVGRAGFLIGTRPSHQEMSREMEMGLAYSMPNLPRTPGGVAYMTAAFPSPFIGAEPRVLGSRKTGGKINKTGLYLVHKNEVVVPASRVKSVDKALKQSGRKALKK